MQTSAVGLVALLAVACGKIAGVDAYEFGEAQCSTDEDCANRDVFSLPGSVSVCLNSKCESIEPEDPTWLCLDEPAPETPAGVLVYRVTIQARSIQDFRPISGATVKLCRKLDTECKEPMSPPGLVTDDNGDAVIHVPNDLPAYVSIDKFDETLPREQWADQWAPAFYYFNPNVAGDMVIAVQMATFKLLGILTLLVERPQEADRGLILMNVVSCLGTGASGVTFKVDRADGNTRPFYFLDGVPKAGLNATNSDGFGGWVNVPSGPVVVAGEVLETGRLVDSADVDVRSNAMTYTRLVARGQQVEPE